MSEDRIQKRYQLRKAAGKYWLLDMEQTLDAYKQPIPFNEVGARIWELLAENHSIEEIVEILSKEYEATKAEIQPDVEDFLDQLKQKGILTR